MHPYILSIMAVCGGAALVIYHLARLIGSALSPPRSLRRIIPSIILLFLAVLLTYAYWGRAFAYTGAEIPINTAGVNEASKEFWLKLAPNEYWADVSFYRSQQAMFPFHVEYSIYVNDKLVLQRGEDITTSDDLGFFYDTIVVKSRDDVIHVVLHAKAGNEEQELPQLLFGMQTGFGLQDYVRPRLSPWN